MAVKRAMIISFCGIRSSRTGKRSIQGRDELEFTPQHETNSCLLTLLGVNSSSPRTELRRFTASDRQSSDTRHPVSLLVFMTLFVCTLVRPPSVNCNSLRLDSVPAKELLRF